MQKKIPHCTPKQILFLFFSLIGTSLFGQKPIISSFSPVSGPVGTSVIISGSNFSSVATNNIVFFGAVNATVSAATTTSLTVTVPAGSTYQPISVTTGGLTGYSVTSFVVTFPGGTDLSYNSFEPKVDSLTGTNPGNITIADFDGDGKPDVATANEIGPTTGSGSVSVLRNITSGGKRISFAPQLEYITGGMTFDVASGDLNGDGKPDLVSCSVVDHTISIFKNTSTPGNISFAPKEDISLVNTTYNICIADVDNDGKADILVTDHLLNVMSVFRNISSGSGISFAAKVDFATQLSPQYVTAGDLNSDGKTDIAVTNMQSNSVSVFTNQSTPGSILFAPRVDYYSGSRPQCSYIADFNKDGKLDLAVSNTGGIGLSFFRNISSGTTISFYTLTTYNIGNGNGSPQKFSIGDLNGDGMVDIVVEGTFLDIFQNTSTSSNISFSDQLGPYVSSPSSVFLADLDADGKDDIAVSQFNSNTISFIRNKNNEPFIKSFTPASAAPGVSITLTGINFNGTLSVTIGGAPANFTVLNNTTITTIVPLSVAGDSIVVTNQYGAGKINGFIYGVPPVINSFTPAAAGLDQAVKISGKNFTWTSAVSFGGVPANSYTVVSSDTIIAVVGNGASGNIKVTTSSGTDSIAGFTYLPLPKITSFIPTTAATGAIITITGLNLDATTSVSFGGVNAASFHINSSTSITAVLASGASGNLEIITSYGTGVLSGFTFIPAPIINFFSPQSGKTGSMISIFGSNFTSATEVRFGNLVADSFLLVSPTQINAVVGSGSSGSVNVVAPGGANFIQGFSFIPAPKITSVMPETGPAGSAITIYGSDLNSATKISIGSIQAKVTAMTSNSISIIVPQVTTNKPVEAAFGNLTATSDNPFTTMFAATDTSFSENSFLSSLKVKGVTDPDNFITCDIDGDMKLDIIEPDYILKKITVLRNTSNSYSVSFGSKIDLNSSWLPSEVVAGDIDGDGKPDLVSGSRSYSNAISIFKNKSTPGNITFEPTKVLSTKNTPNIPLALSDLDGDGRLDIIAEINDSITVYRNKSVLGKINFDNPVSFYCGFADDMLAEDIDGDIKPDIIFNSPQLACLRNTSSPGIISFSPIYKFGTAQANFLSIGDVNGDGKKDIVAVTGYYGKTISIYENKSTPGSISFLTDSIFSFSASGISYLNVGDLNGDGKPEIVTLQGSNKNQFSVFKNTSTIDSIKFAANFDFPYVTNHYFQASQIADIDGDNKMDILISTQSADSIHIYKNLVGNSSLFTCSNAVTSINSNLVGSSYQWQENSGSGFQDISNNSIYSGVNSITLQINSLPVSNYNYQYRCFVNGNYSNETTIKFLNKWTGVINTSWENPGNWSCGSVPDANTDVYISNGTVILNSNTTVRSISIQPSSNFTIANGISLTVTH